MLADLVDHVVGVDPERDRVTVTVVDAKTQATLACAEFPTTTSGYSEATSWADHHSTQQGRVWSIEGAGRYGAGLCMVLTAAAE